ncbi:hypothetical protein AV530_013563 [Patagioenas fasciata monilis]|uniref:Secreted protein n=1 Tax=Patagioenas fasciata monilis TaxID=372326 RepID=A0A1V4JPU0_PATFA|nr:hypothetical protein AV530_013563 [Patagioenas fasciata monilis]
MKMSSSRQLFALTLGFPVLQSQWQRPDHHVCNPSTTGGAIAQLNSKLTAIGRKERKRSSGKQLAEDFRSGPWRPLG